MTKVLSGNAAVDAAIHQVANGDPVLQEYLHATVVIESGDKSAAKGADPNAYNSGSGAAGAWQFIPSTAAAYGLSDPHNPVEAAKAALKLREDNRSTFVSAVGREPTNAELYGLHQQGAGGFSELMKNPNGNVVDVLAKAYDGSRGTAASAVTGNAGKTDMTAGQFASMWTGKYDELVNKLKANDPSLPYGGKDDNSPAPATSPTLVAQNALHTGAPPTATNASASEGQGQDSNNPMGFLGGIMEKAIQFFTSNPMGMMLGIGLLIMGLGKIFGGGNQAAPQTTMASTAPTAEPTPDAPNLARAQEQAKENSPKTMASTVPETVREAPNGPPYTPSVASMPEGAQTQSI